MNMGDRAHVYIHEGGNPGVYLYTHWNGTDLPAIVQAGLKRAGGAHRLTDPGYLTRIVVCEMIKDCDGLDGVLGVGITATGEDFGDGARVVDIDTRAGTVEMRRGRDQVLGNQVPMTTYIHGGPVAWPPRQEDDE